MTKIQNIAAALTASLDSLDTAEFSDVVHGKADFQAPAEIKSDVDAWIAECLTAEGKTSDAADPARFGATYDAMLSLTAEAGRHSDMGDVLRCGAVFDGLMRLHCGVRPSWM